MVAELQEESPVHEQAPITNVAPGAEDRLKSLQASSSEHEPNPIANNEVVESQLMVFVHEKLRRVGETEGATVGGGVVGGGVVGGGVVYVRV